ncbi:hypothetical protein LWC34_40360 [Kibdelosporangium philippinense]|uniref:DUF4367 domain-containing protein n=1 Tax=Kibdelosporangium philippinense TaxID=211113 RepID=A0ABS8ZN73_9PSEU|nr:hypothetical protein [Kibdelosporangium philippinense]MCE7009024.1 hypothetical protein [Kibdelosporangium philippinense]
MTENEGQRMLAPLRELDPDTRSTVDVTKAKVAGRRMSRRRIVAGAVAVAGVFALIGASVPILSSAYSADPVAPAVTEPAFGPLYEAVTVGKAGGFRPNLYKTGRDRQTIDLVRDDGSTGGGLITVYPPGAARDEMGVKGPGPGMFAGDVKFEWAPGALATVQVVGPEPDMQARAEQIRQSVAVAKDKKVKVPFTVDKAALGALKVAAVITMYDPTEPIKVTVLLSASEAVERGSMMLTATLGGYGPGPKEKLGDHEATVVGNDYGVEYIGISDRGSKMNLTTWNVIDQLALAKAVIGSVRFVPDATNPANWADNPIR